MRKVYSLLCLLLLAMAAGAQKTYFIYFQTEGNTPFYLKMGEKVMSSSSGYFILPELPDSIYTVAIGFPSVLVESRFRLTVNGADQGFIIRNPGNTPSLSDLSNGAVVAPFVDESERNVTYQQRTDAFTTLLARAAGDPTLIYAVVRTAPAPKTDPVVNTQKDAPPKNNDSAVARTTPADTVSKAVSTTVSTPQTVPAQDSVTNLAIAPGNKLPDSSLVTTVTTTIDTVATASKPQTETPRPVDSSTTIVQPPPVVDTVQSAPAYVRSVVKKHAESSTGEGFGLVYYDRTGEGTDTIRLLIPNPRIVLKPRDTTADEGQMLNRSELKPVTSAPAPAADSAMVSKPVNSCKALASESDFIKLRKAMAGKTSDEGMVEEAKRAFRSRCFTTDQVRGLAGLFITSAGKYQFFDAAYAHVSDPEVFPALASEISNDYYLKRFKALVGQ